MPKTTLINSRTRRRGIFETLLSWLGSTELKRYEPPLTNKQINQEYDWKPYNISLSTHPHLMFMKAGSLNNTPEDWTNNFDTLERKIARDKISISRWKDLYGKEGGSGTKDDSNKLRMDLVPPELLFAVADILTFGVVKHGERVWEKGLPWGDKFGALMRHLWSWWGGESQDPETGKSHLWHAASNLAFLIAFEKRGIGVDNRWKGLNDVNT